jgi:hypothetical protein
MADELRGQAMAIDFTVKADGDPQKFKTKWFATPSTGGPAFLVGYTANFSDGDGAHRGLAQTRFLSEIPKLFYDRKASEADFGLWSHFIWPTVVAESAGGHHLLVNTYDRARFTFGFYQLAAHTPGDNLILLFRRLAALPKAKDYFPDLLLKNGKLHRQLPGSQVSLETVTSVQRPNGKVEDQLVAFMTYLNPDTLNVGEIEARHTARLMHWLLNDPEAVKASVGAALDIVRRKAKAIATTYALRGKPAELAIWVSDITHQGRGGKAAIKAALAKPTHQAKLDALFAIGSENADYDGRRKAVRDKIAVLRQEKVFDGVTLGDAKLPLP